MTTKVTVYAHAGRAVDVSAFDPRDEESEAQALGRVESGQQQDYYVHYAQDLLIHEVTDDEIAEENKQADEYTGSKDDSDDGNTVVS